MTTTVIFLLIFAFILFFLELFAPGGILGLLGVISLVGSSIMAYETLGILGSAAILLGGLLLGLALFFIEIKLLKVSPFRKDFQHADRQTAKTNPVGRPELVGQQGVALTTMAPSGKVNVENEVFEAASNGGLIKKSTTVEVVRSEHLKLIVKEI